MVTTKAKSVSKAEAIANVNRPTLEVPFVVVSATEAQNNFSKYAKIASTGKDVVIERNNKEYVRLISSKKAKPTLLEFAGILSDMPHMSIQMAAEERAMRHEAIHRH